MGQSLLLGGLFISCSGSRGPGAEIPKQGLDRVRSFGFGGPFRYAAVGLAIVQVLYLYVNASVLMATAEIWFPEDAIGANFFISGSVMLVAALLIAILETSNRKPVSRSTHSAFWF